MSSDLSNAVSAPVMMQLADGETYTFSRATPRIMAELGSWYRASRNGDGFEWTSIDECVRLAQTIEGMEWLAWRCACEHHPEVKQRGHKAFRSLTNDFGVLTNLIARITDFPGEEDGPTGNTDGGTA